MSKRILTYKNNPLRWGNESIHEDTPLAAQSTRYMLQKHSKGAEQGAQNVHRTPNITEQRKTLALFGPPEWGLRSDLLPGGPHTSDLLMAAAAQPGRAQMRSEHQAFELSEAPWP